MSHWTTGQMLLFFLACWLIFLAACSIAWTKTIDHSRARRILKAQRDDITLRGPR